MRLSQLGKKSTLESREKMSMSAKGKVISQETREKLRIANIGKKMSPEAIEKTAQSNRGRKLSDAVKDVIRQKLKGKKRDPEAVRKMVETNSTPILQFDLKGNFIAEYKNCYDAVNNTECKKSGLYYHLNKNTEKYKGFKFKYKQ